VSVLRLLPELLDAFLKEPQAPPFRGNKMPFAGMPDAQARADLIAYLKQETQ
jgi:cytochrome c2